MPRNPGKQPEETKGKRVKVRFVNGVTSTRYDPPHWPADTLNWSISKPPHPADITHYEVE